MECSDASHSLDPAKFFPLRLVRRNELPYPVHSSAQVKVMKSTEYGLCLIFVLLHLRVSHSFISRGPAKYQDLLEEVMLLHILLALASESLVAREMLRREQCCVYPMRLTILIVLTSKDLLCPS